MTKEKAASPASAQQSAFRLLARRDHSRQELMRKLAAKGFAAAEIEEVLRSLAARGLLDDARYAEHFARSLAESKFFGPKQISQKLFQKGIPADLIQQVLQTTEESLPSKERLQRVLKSKLKNRNPGQLPPKEKRKLGNFLYQRGFLWEQISEAFQELGGFEE